MSFIFQPVPAGCAGLFAWLQRPEKAYTRWQGKLMVGVAWLGLLLAAINPPHGTGIIVCGLKLCTGISCPGCGLTRSLSCGLHGMFAESWQYHPLGLFILALFIATAIRSLLPSLWQERIRSWMESRAFIFNSFYLAFVTTFIGFGTVRALIELAHRLALN
jgi:hypothetical protein